MSQMSLRTCHYTEWDIKTVFLNYAIYTAPVHCKNNTAFQLSFLSTQVETKPDKCANICTQILLYSEPKNVHIFILL